MLSYRFRRRRLCLTLLLTITTVDAASSGKPATSAPFCAEVEISQRQLRADGVETSERYRERLYRTDTVIAFERIVPMTASQTSGAAAHEPDHGHAHDHAHVEQLIRRYEKRPDGQISYSLFDDRGRREIQLQESEFQAFGFDGNFAALHALVDPALLPTLGKNDQTLRQPDRELHWSGRDQILRSLQKRWLGGDYSMTVTPTQGCTDPQQSRRNYAAIDYADTLD